MNIFLIIGKALIDIIIIIKNTLSIFQKKKEDTQAIIDTQKVEEEIKNKDVEKLNEELGWKK